MSVAQNGEEGLAKFQASTPHLVITDIQMPRMNGCDLLENIRQTSPSMPVILITAHATIDARREAERLQANGFVNKPIDLDDLLETVQRLL